MFSCKFFGSSRRHCPFVRFSLANVQFVSDEHQNNVGLSMLFYFTYPLLNIFERLLLGNIIDEERPQRFPVMCRSDGLESLLPSCNQNNFETNVLTCVPDLNSDSAASFEGHWLGGKFDTNRGHLLPGQLTPNVPA